MSGSADITSAKKEKKPKKNNPNAGLFLWGFSYWRHRMPMWFITLFCSLMGMACDLIMPLLGADVINYFFTDEHLLPENDPFLFLFETEQDDPLKVFGRVAVAFAIVVAVRVVFIYLKNVSKQYNAVGMETDFRKITYHHLMKLDSGTIASVNSGELITLIDGDLINAKELYATDCLSLIESFVMIASSIVFLISFSPILLVMPLLFVPFFLITLRSYSRTLRDLHNENREITSGLNLTVNENLHAVRIIRSFVGEEQEKKRFNEYNDRIRDIRVKIDKAAAKYSALFGTYNQFAYALTIAVSAVLVIRGNMLLGSLSASIAYVLKIMNHIGAISSTFGIFQSRYVSLSRLRMFMEKRPAIEDGPVDFVPSARPHLEMRDVTVTIGGTDLLKHIDLDIPFGKKIGIMGETGAGKSVLLKSLSRIYDATQGEILLDGVNVKDIPLETLRRQFGYVFQDVFLFSRAIDANIAYYDDTAEHETVERYAKIAEAHHFITKLPQGYDTVVGERGVGISGGQKQRVSIARALLKNAPVLVLDDASSALDMTTEQRVMNGIKKNCPDVTMLIAAHRVSSVMDVDEVLYMDAGEIVERGTPAELLAKNGRFAAVYRIQQEGNALDDSAYGNSEIEKEGRAQA